MAVVVSSTFADETTPKVSVTCKAQGVAFRCVVNEAAEFKIAPKWIFLLDPAYEVWGDEFHYMAPKEWTILEARVFPDDNWDSPYDNISYIAVYVWVRKCSFGRRDRAVFHPVRKGIKPPQCDQKTLDSK